MTAVVAPAAPAFRLEMLWRDERYRAGFIQAVAMIVLMAAAGWIVSNVVANLSALGKDFDFSFLWQPASYDINQRLIDYDSRDTNARAALVGILNTLLVALLGCISATAIGIVAGVLRLSGNWLVARLMALYVDVFRNVPVLLWILLTAAVVNETLPTPRALRDVETGAVVATNRGVYVPMPVLEPGWGVLAAVLVLSIAGFWAFQRGTHRRREATGHALMPLPAAARWTLAAATGLVAAAVAAVVGQIVVAASPLDPSGAAGRVVLAALAVGGGAAAARRALDAQGAALGLLILIVPTAVAYLLLGRPVTFDYPELAGFNFRGGLHLRDSLIALWLALSLYTGAFIAETVRAGILSVSHGQSEAAFALGLSPGRTMSLVVLPQALRVIVPPLISQFLNLTKNSSLAIAVGYMDVTGTLGGITLNQTGREMECLLLLMGFYLVLSLVISAAMNAYNARVKLVER